MWQYTAFYSVFIDTDIYCEFDCANLTKNDESSNQSRCRGGKKMHQENRYIPHSEFR